MIKTDSNFGSKIRKKREKGQSKVTYRSGTVENETGTRKKLDGFVLCKLEGNSQCSHCSRANATNHLFALLCAAAVDHRATSDPLAL